MDAPATQPDALSSDAKDLLRRTPIFGGLIGQEIERLAALMRRKEFQPGDTIVCEGDPGREMYIIRHGRVAVERNAGSTGTVTIATLGEFDAFGEMSVIDIQPRSATVRAMEPTVVYSLSNRDLHQLSQRELKTFTLIVMNIAREISRRLRETDRALVEMDLAGKVRLSKPIL